MTNKKSLNDLSVDDLAMTLHEYLCNQTVDISRIFAILMGIHRVAVNVKSKWHVKRIIKKIYEDAMECTNRSKVLHEVGLRIVPILGVEHFG